MWICTEDGFVSIVRDTSRPGNLLVRARDRKHLEVLFSGTIDHTPERDYPWRVSVSSEAIENVVSGLVRMIDYPNFKGRVDAKHPGSWYGRALHSVWEVLFLAAASRR